MSNVPPHGPQPPPDPTIAHSEPGDAEEVYFNGSPPVRAFSGALTLFSLGALAILAIAGLLVHKHYGPWWVPLILLLAAIALAAVPLLSARSIHYRITNYRIDYERGLLAKNIDTLELWHVEDLHFHQTLMDRILNVGDITVISRDDTLPKLAIRGIPNPRPLFETLKQRVIAVKRQRGVIKMDPG